MWSPMDLQLFPCRLVHQMFCAKLVCNSPSPEIVWNEILCALDYSIISIYLLDLSSVSEACPDELCSLPLMSRDNRRVAYPSPIFVARRVGSSVHQSMRNSLMVKPCPTRQTFKDHARFLSRPIRERGPVSRFSIVFVLHQVRLNSPNQTLQ
jgi:hypothetical protein